MVDWDKKLKAMITAGRLKKVLEEIGSATGGYFRNLGPKMGFKDSREIELSPEEKMRQEVWCAHREWANAIRNLDFVNDTDLIDYFIYNIETNQKRFIYLLKQAKEQNLSVTALEPICTRVPGSKKAVSERGLL